MSNNKSICTYSAVLNYRNIFHRIIDWHRSNTIAWVTLFQINYGDVLQRQQFTLRSSVYVTVTFKIAFAFSYVIIENGCMRNDTTSNRSMKKFGSMTFLIMLLIRWARRSHVLTSTDDIIFVSSLTRTLFARRTCLVFVTARVQTISTNVNTHYHSLSISWQFRMRGVGYLF